MVAFMKRLETILIDEWTASIPHEVQDRAVQALENGQVLFFPHLPFALSDNEIKFLSGREGRSQVEKRQL